MVQVRVFGGGREIGRSCVLVSSHDAGVLLDCGLHPGRKDWKDRLPPNLAYFRRNPPDAVVITHYHLDHVGALPYLTEVLKYEGPVYMTEPTKSLALAALLDFLRVHDRGAPFSVQDVHTCLSRVRLIRLGEAFAPTDAIDVTCVYAGHALGGVMVQVILNGSVILYTGDISTTSEQCLRALEPGHCARPDLLICESTYATRMRDGSRMQREQEFLSELYRALENGGRVLIPAFAVGRTQELLLLITCFFEATNLHYPVFVSSALAGRANEIVVEQTDKRAWLTEDACLGDGRSLHHALEHRLRSFTNLQISDSSRPFVLITAPAMLNAGFSRKVFQQWCTDERTLVALPGYGHAGGGDCGVDTNDDAATRTKSRPSLSSEIPPSALQEKCTIARYSLSAHADAKGLFQLVRRTGARRVALVHGERSTMSQFQRLLASDLKIPVDVPENGASLEVGGRVPSARKSAFPLAEGAILVTDGAREKKTSRRHVEQAIECYRSGQGVVREGKGGYNVQISSQETVASITSAVRFAVSSLRSEVSRYGCGGADFVLINRRESEPAGRIGRDLCASHLQARSMTFTVKSKEGGGLAGSTLRFGCEDLEDLELMRTFISAVTSQMRKEVRAA